MAVTVRPRLSPPLPRPASGRRLLPVPPNPAAGGKRAPESHLRQSQLGTLTQRRRLWAPKGPARMQQQALHGHVLLRLQTARQHWQQGQSGVIAAILAMSALQLSAMALQRLLLASSTTAAVEKSDLQRSLHRCMAAGASPSVPGWQLSAVMLGSRRRQLLLLLRRLPRHSLLQGIHQSALQQVLQVCQL
jgi:hypothetical protein